MPRISRGGNIPPPVSPLEAGKTSTSSGTGQLGARKVRIANADAAPARASQHVQIDKTEITKMTGGARANLISETYRSEYMMPKEGSFRASTQLRSIVNFFKNLLAKLTGEGGAAASQRRT